MKRLACFAASLAFVFLSASDSHALKVGPAHPGLDDGTSAPRTQSAEPVSPGRANEIQNLDTGFLYSSIQAAHDDAATLPGHTLEVQGGAVLTEGPQIVITKGITLRGQTGTEVILQSADTGSSGNARGWFLVDAAATGFTVENLNFDGNGFKIWQGFRIFASDCSFDNCTLNDMQYDASGPSYAGTAIVTADGANLSVTNCTLSQIGRNGLFYFGVGATGCVAANNTYTGKGAGDWLDYGIEVGGGAIVAASGNTITECRGVASSDGSTSAAVLVTTYYGPGTAADLAGNFLNANTGAIAAGYDAADTSILTATDNDFSGNDTYTVGNTSATALHDCSANWHGSNAAATVAAGVTAGVDYTPWLDNGTDTDLGTPGFQGDFSTLNVDDDSPQVGATPRVQEAINLVTASTVNVSTGTYGGNLSLNKSVQLNGANAGVSACGRVAGGVPNAATETILTAPSGIILQLLNGCAGSTIDGFAIDGAGVAGNGIRSNGGPLTGVTIRNNWIGRTTSSGIFLNDSGVDITIHQNELDGSAAGGGGYLHLDQDNFDGMHVTDNCVLNAASGTGLFVDGNHNVGPSVARAPEISGNVFDGNATGANLGRFAFELGTITGNTFSNSGFDGLQGGIQSTTISGNLFDSNGRYGLALTGFGGGGDPTRGAQNCTITGNTFTGNVIQGILFSSSQFPGTISTNVVNGNDITGNVGGAAYSGSEVIDVSCNWWGDLGGPDAPGNPNPAGDDISGGTLVFWPWLDGSIVGSPNCDQYGGNNVAAEPAGCINIDNPCETVSVNLNRTDTTGARGISVTFELSSEIELCVDAATSIAQGTWLSGYGTTFQVVDNGGGSYTVDQAILGLPCGVTGGGELFKVDVQAAGGDGSGTITVTEVILRDCANAPLPGIPGPPASVLIDTVPPGAVADLAAAQVKTGNDSDGTTRITLTFGTPVDADEFIVYRKGYGDYPEYDDGFGAVPTLPATPAAAVGDGWELTTVAASGQDDETTVRDYWYYVVFVEDACDNVSAVSNMTDGTLNYHLGDVSDGSTPCQGDNLVGVPDVSLLGANYGITITYGDPVNCLDVGPTDDFSVNGLPTTDDEIGFEDLILFAINYGQVSAPRAAPTPAGEATLFQPAIAMELSQEGETTVARLSLVDNPDHVKGIHAFVSLGGLEVVSAESGSLVRTQGAPVFFETVQEDGGVWVDLALLGRDLAFEGSGEVAVLTLSGDGAAQLGDVVLRDRKNRDASRSPVDSDPPAPEQATASEATGLPSRVELTGARPNPFGQSTDIAFQLPASMQVSVVVYDVSGRRVRTLVDRALPAGQHLTRWDGRTDAGQSVSAGVYFYTFRAGDLRETRKLLHFR
jgi:hypothetical protein